MEPASHTWSAFANLSTTAISAPNCASDHENRVVCSFYTIGSQIVVARYSNSAWQGFINLSGLGTGLVDCTYWKPTGRRNLRQHIQRQWLGGKHWSSFSNVGGLTNDVPGCVSQASGELACLTVGAMNKNILFANVYDDTGWSGWTQETGTAVGSPSCAPLATGKVICAFRGVNNEYSRVVGP